MESSVIYGLRLDEEDAPIRYVGLTVNGADRRLRSHMNAALRGVDFLLYRWMRNVGVEHVAVEVLEEVEVPADLPDRERYWIQELGTHTSLRTGGLNCTWGGEWGNVWDSLTDDQKYAQRLRMREVQKIIADNPKYADQRRERSRAVMLEINARPEVIKDKSDRMKKLHKDPDFAKATSARSSAHMKNKHKDPEFAARRDQRSRDRWNDPQYREKVTKAAAEAGRHSGHKRWHLGRGIVKDGCTYCEAER